MRTETQIPSSIPGLTLTNLRIRYVSGNYMFSLFLADIVSIELKQEVVNPNRIRGVIPGTLVCLFAFIVAIRFKEEIAAILVFFIGIAIIVWPFLEKDKTRLNLKIIDSTGRDHNIYVQDIPSTQIVAVIDAIEDSRMQLM